MDVYSRWREEFHIYVMAGGAADKGWLKRKVAILLSVDGPLVEYDCSFLRRRVVRATSNSSARSCSAGVRCTLLYEGSAECERRLFCARRRSRDIDAVGVELKRRA